MSLPHDTPQSQQTMPKGLKPYLRHLPDWIYHHPEYAKLRPGDRYALHVLCGKCDRAEKSPVIVYTTEESRGRQQPRGRREPPVKKQMNCDVRRGAKAHRYLVRDIIGMRERTFRDAKERLERIGFLVTVAPGGGRTSDGRPLPAELGIPESFAIAEPYPAESAGLNGKSEANARADALPDNPAESADLTRRDSSTNPAESAEHGGGICRASNPLPQSSSKPTHESGAHASAADHQTPDGEGRTRAEGLRDDDDDSEVVPSRAELEKRLLALEGNSKMNRSLAREIASDERFTESEIESWIVASRGKKQPPGYVRECWRNAVRDRTGAAADQRREREDRAIEDRMERQREADEAVAAMDDDQIIQACQAIVDGAGMEAVDTKVHETVHAHAKGIAKSGNAKWVRTKRAAANLRLAVGQVAMGAGV